MHLRGRPTRATAGWWETDGQGAGIVTRLHGSGTRSRAGVTAASTPERSIWEDCEP
jgi:hypothetical protein